MALVADTALGAMLAEIVEAQEQLRPVYAALRGALRRSQSPDVRKTLHEQLAQTERRLRLLATTKAAGRALLAHGYPDAPLPHTNGGSTP